MKCFFVNGYVYSCWIIIDFPYVLKRRELQAVQRPKQETSRRFFRHTCRPYVLQMRRNELKYGFYCQNPTGFRKYIFQFFINKALPASSNVLRQNFMGKKF